ETRILERHFLESAVLVRLDLSSRCRCLDLGTGGGFPGVPLKIMNNKIHLTLLDSRRVKSLFLRKVVRILSFSGIEVVCDRAEVSARQPELAGKYDVVLARAVTDLVRLYGLAHPFLKSQGRLIAIKGSSLEAEAHELRETIPGISLHIQSLPVRVKNGVVELRVALVDKSEAWVQ
ncbi:16S rRNA (guanine(527)-N(7))-methyltransferase RsmG, partial [bacterium]|nr:16S rRNA (guanine(527)-N(7))-methyltransferase RsmG [bacterium]